jgi:hypothetical protein
MEPRLKPQLSLLRAGAEKCIQGQTEIEKGREKRGTKERRN